MCYAKGAGSRSRPNLGDYHRSQKAKTTYTRVMNMKYIRITGGTAFMNLTRADVRNWQLYGTTFSEWEEETGKDYTSWVREKVIPALDLFDYLAWYEDGSLFGYEGGYNVILDRAFGLWSNAILARAKELGMPVEEMHVTDSGCWIG